MERSKTKRRAGLLAFVLLASLASMGIRCDDPPVITQPPGDDPPAEDPPADDSGADDSSAGEGQTCGTIAGLACPEGQYCDHAAGDGCDIADGAGVCAIKPDLCTTDYSPVCGCDGETYSNACSAASAGVSLRGEGECPVP